MANLLYSDLFSEVLPYLTPGVSNPLAESVIKRSAIEFCRESWVWKVFADVQPVFAGVAEYDIDSPQGADVCVLMTVIVDGVKLLPKTSTWLDENRPNWRTARARVEFYTQATTEQLILAMVPDSHSANALEMTLVLQPSRASTFLPGWMGSQYGYQIAEGAIARLMMMPYQPWTDIQGGADRRAKFEGFIASARSGAASGLNRSATRTTSQH